MSNNNWMVVLTTNKAKGNALAGLIDPAPGGNRTFDYGCECYPAGTTFTFDGLGRTASNPPSAWVTGVRASDATAALAAEFMSDGPYPLLNARGIDDATVADFKADIYVECGPYESTSNRVITLVAERGLVR